MNCCLLPSPVVTGARRRLRVGLLLSVLAFVAPAYAQEAEPAPTVAMNRQEAIHHLLAAWEARRSAEDNRLRLSHGLALHLERLSGLRQRLLYAREQVDIQTRQAGQFMVAQAEPARIEVAMAALQAVEQQAIGLYRQVDQAERQVAFAREAIGEARQRADETAARAAALRQEVEALPAEPGDPEIEPLLLRIMGQADGLEEQRERHVDICPWCQEKRR